MRSLLEMVILDSGSFSWISLVLAGIMLVVKTCLAYFLREELDSPSPMKLMEMVSIVILKLRFCVL